MKKIFLFLLLSLASWNSYGQIDFESYEDYSLTAGGLNNSDLDFGPVVRGSNIYNLDISNSKIIAITGVEYLDVIVEVSAESSLYLNGNISHSGDPQRSIPFDLKAAYANNEGSPNLGQAKFITEITGNSFIKRLPLLERQHAPPGPPPPPPTNAFEQSQVEETAYLYLYGSINVGDVNAGSYSSEITVTINYD